MRRLLPMNALRAFEAAGRSMSFTVAAEELNVTQVAVSRQVRVLEDYLEIPLFHRGHRSIRLTEDGERLLGAIAKALEDVDRVVSSISMRGRRDVLAIQAYSTIAQRWLIPRLGDFHERYPNVEVRLTASLRPVSFERQNIHAAIRSGRGSFEGCECDLVAPIELMPVCHPRHASNGRLAKPADLRRFTRLHSLARRDDWDDWLRSAGVGDTGSYRTLKFESTALALEAALQGIGVAICARVVVDDDLRAGRLVAPFEHTHVQPDSYYLVRSRNRPATPALRTFRDWLLADNRRAGCASSGPDRHPVASRAADRVST